MTTFPNLEMERNRTQKRMAYYKKLLPRRQGQRRWKNESIYIYEFRDTLSPLV